MNIPPEIKSNETQWKLSWNKIDYPPTHLKFRLYNIYIVLIENGFTRFCCIMHVSKLLVWRYICRHVDYFSRSV